MMSTSARDHATEAAVIMNRSGEGSPENRRARAAEAQAHAMTALALDATESDNPETISDDTIVYVVQMDTDSFSFTTAGSTEVEAISAMVKTMRLHRGPDGDAWDEHDYPHEFRNGVDYGLISDDGDPDEIAEAVDRAWLTALIRDWYSARVIELRIGAVGARDGEVIS